VNKTLEIEREVIDMSRVSCFFDSQCIFTLSLRGWRTLKVETAVAWPYQSLINSAFHPSRVGKQVAIRADNLSKHYRSLISSVNLFILYSYC